MQYPRSLSPDVQQIARQNLCPAGFIAKTTQTPLNGCRDCLAQHTVLLPGSDNLGVHSHQVVVDGVLLLFLRFLDWGIWSVRVLCECGSVSRIWDLGVGEVCWKTYRLVHALAQLSLEGRTALGAVSV